MKETHIIGVFGVVGVTIMFASGMFSLNNLTNFYENKLKEQKSFYEEKLKVEENKKVVEINKAVRDSNQLKHWSQESIICELNRIESRPVSELSADDFYWMYSLIAQKKQNEMMLLEIKDAKSRN